MKLPALILAPIDVDSCPPSHLQWIATVARLFKARVELFYTAAERVNLSREEDLLESLGHQLRSLLAPIGGELDIAMRPFWDPAQAILIRAQEICPDLVIMAPQPRSGWSELVEGSISDQILYSAPCPMLFIPQGSSPPSPHPFRRMLVPTDLEQFAPLDMASSWAQVCRSHVSWLYVVDRVHAHLLDLSREEGAELAFQRRLDEGAAELKGFLRRTGDLSSRSHLIVAAGDAADEILAYTHTDRADLVVMGHHPQPGLFTRLLKGSVAEDVVDESRCPVLVVSLGERPPVEG